MAPVMKIDLDAITVTATNLQILKLVVKLANISKRKERGRVFVCATEQIKMHFFSCSASWYFLSHKIMV